MSDLKQQNVIISKEAIDMAYLLYEDENNKNLNLRISVEGGGCSGFKYNFTFDDKINNDDNIIDLKNNLKLTIDFLSLQYLQGATIDFKNDMEGAQFVIENPNATSTCGCGNSFSI